MRRETWKKQLEPYAEFYRTAVIEIQDAVAELNDADLEALAHACTYPTTSNCASATFRVTPLVLREVRTEQYKRKENKVKA